MSQNTQMTIQAVNGQFLVGIQSLGGQAITSGWHSSLTSAINDVGDQHTSRGGDGG